MGIFMMPGMVMEVMASASHMAANANPAMLMESAMEYSGFLHLLLCSSP